MKQMFSSKFSVGIAGAVLAAAVMYSIPVSADPNSPVGDWKTVDDDTGKVKSIVRIWQKDGKIYGKIVKLFLEPHEDQNPLCDKCEGSHYNKPILGMTIMRNLKKDGDEWNGGTIMDPENGESYKCLIEVIGSGKKLKVRGYIGISLLGRTQYWIRTK